MKQCPACSAVNDEDDIACGVCGANLSEAKHVAIGEASKESDTPPDMQSRPKVHENKRTNLFHECPFCHKHFVAELISKDQVDNSQLSPSDLPLVRPPTRGPDLGLTRRAEVIVTFRLNYKCKHCGKEWSRTTTEQYTQNEDEKP